MPLSPEGPISVNLAGVRTLLAGVAYWQTLTNTANPTDAAARIFLNEISTPVASLAVSGGIMTVTLREPLALVVGQKITLDGAAIGDRGATLAGTYTILALGDNTARIPWMDADGNTWVDADGNEWTYASDEVFSFTVATRAANAPAFAVDGVELLPCARPFAVVSYADDDTLHAHAVAIGVGLLGGSADILIQWRVSAAYRNSPQNAQLEAYNIAGQIIAGMNDISGQADFMLLNEISIVAGPQFRAAAEQTDGGYRFEFAEMLIRVKFGLEG